MGHDLQAVASPQNSLFFLFMYVVTFSFAILLPRKKTISDAIYGMIAFTNILNFILLLALEVLIVYSNNYVTADAFSSSYQDSSIGNTRLINDTILSEVGKKCNSSAEIHNKKNIQLRSYAK